MKYTIEGFSQQRLVELDLGYVEAALLRWLVDFAHTGKMREITDAHGKRLWWVQYDAVAEDLPALGIQNPEVMRRRFARLVLAGVLIHQHVQQRGRFSYYGFGPQYESLILSKEHSTTESSEAPDEPGHSTEESSEGDEHSTAESDEGPSEPVDSTVESAPIRPFGRRSLDSGVGSNDSSTRDPSTRTQEETARASTDVEHLPDHMALAVRWYRQYTQKTGRLVSPGGDDFLAAEKAIARAEPGLLFGAIEPYFSGEYWFTRDKRTKQHTYSFRGFLAHFPEVLAARPAVAPKPKAERHCSCGRGLTFGTGRFTRCTCGRAWEIDDAGELEDVTREAVNA